VTQTVPNARDSEPETVPTPQQSNGAFEPKATAPASASDPQPSTKRSAEAEQTAPSTGRKRQAEGALRVRNILLLEDDDAVIELLELTLAARGARLFTIRSPAELTDALCRERFDTLLVDLSPVRGELEALLERARRLEPEIVVLVISGEPTPRPLPDTLWVRKPFDPSELVTAIAETTKAPRSPSPPSPTSRSGETEKTT
jgi:CheY-like chemotaxis protein